MKGKYSGSGRNHLVHVQCVDENVPVHIALDSFYSSDLNLACLSAYGGQPNLSGVWMYQRAMSVRLDIESSPDFINNLLSINFRCMEVVTTPKPIHLLLIWPIWHSCGGSKSAIKNWMNQVILLEPHLRNWLPWRLKGLGLKDHTSQFCTLLVQTLGDPVIRPFLQVPTKTRAIPFSLTACYASVDTFSHDVSDYNVVVREHRMLSNLCRR